MTNEQAAKEYALKYIPEMLANIRVPVEEAHLAGQGCANRWWAERWAKYRGIIETHEGMREKIDRLDELDAAAKEALKDG